MAVVAQKLTLRVTLFDLHGAVEQQWIRLYTLLKVKDKYLVQECGYC